MHTMIHVATCRLMHASLECEKLERNSRCHLQAFAFFWLIKSDGHAKRGWLHDLSYPASMSGTGWNSTLSMSAYR